MMRLRFHGGWRGAAGGVLALLLLASGLAGVRAQANPGDGLFSHQCGPTGIAFALRGTLILQPSPTEVAGALARAIINGQHQPIARASGATLYALTSNELQIHLDDDPDGTKYIIPAAVCGDLPLPWSEARALALAEVSGPGRALAYAEVTADGQVTTYAAAAGGGRAYAAANASPGAPNPAPSGRVHVVGRGENLILIALFYGTDVRTLARLNNLVNPDVIYVGQTLILP